MEPMTEDLDPRRAFQTAAARLFATADGQIVLEHLRRHFGFETATTIVRDRTERVDLGLTAFNEGQRCVYRELVVAVERGSIPTEDRQKEAIT